MSKHNLSRREMLQYSGAALAGISLFNGLSYPHTAFAQAGDEMLPWLDQPAENPVPQVVANQQSWEQLDSWITPNDQFFSIAHYNRPEIDAAEWHLEITGDEMLAELVPDVSLASLRR